MVAPSQLSPNQASKMVTFNESKKDEQATTTTTTTTDDAANAEKSKTNKNLDLTYAGTQASEEYVLAKHLLQQGDFDACLETIGEKMSRINASLLINKASSSSSSIHESMAPLYYLYGTTLLYQIMEEESNDNMTTAAAAADGGGGGIMMNTTTTTTPSSETSEEEEEEQVEDLQIAWENLETARFILENMVAASSTTTTDTPSNTTNLQLDLAQVHLRCGDLLKSNSRLMEAIDDYTKCLNIRLVHLGKYHRKVATLYHALGSVHQLLATTISPEQQESSSQDAPLQIQQQQQQQQQHVHMSMEMFVACAKSLAGQIAFLCGSDPEQVTSVEEKDLQQSTGGGGGGGGNKKTTGMNETQVALAHSSSIICILRNRVKDLLKTTTSCSTTTQENQETIITEFKELLDEIQETVDEMETSREGIKQVTEIKEKAKEAVANNNSDGVPVENADGSITTIGFGNTTTPAVVSVSSTTSATTNTTATNKPMMVIKKKKKRDITDDNGDQKMPTQQGDAKRAKKNDE